MQNLFEEAEKEMKELKNPYVGTEHYFLAFLKKYKINLLSYEKFKNIIKKVIGSCYKESAYILYTPILRNLKNNNGDDVTNILEILNDTDSIAYNILLSENYNISDIYKEIKDTYVS